MDIYKNLLLSNPRLYAGSTTGLLESVNNLSDVDDIATARANLGFGTIASQDADNVAITGGSITGITDLAVADGGTGASTLTGYVKGAGTAALTASATIPNTDITGLGTMSTQAASSVAITGGSINGTTIGATTPSTVAGTTGTFSGQLTAANGVLVSKGFNGDTTAGFVIFNESLTNYIAGTGTQLQFVLNNSQVGLMTVTGINNFPIGSTTPSTGAFTTMTASGNVAFGGATNTHPLNVRGATGFNLQVRSISSALTLQAANNADSASVAMNLLASSFDFLDDSLIARASITSTGLNATAIGATTPSTGAFTTLSASGAVTFDGVSFADGTAANTLVTTSAGNVGIGTPTPAGRLSVQAAGGSPVIITGNAQALIGLGSLTASHPGIRADAADRVGIVLADQSAYANLRCNAFTADGAITIGNTVNTVSPTSPDRTITMVIGGTTYYIHAKTTND